MLFRSCFGNPQEAETLIALWTKLELLHYPGAGDTRSWLEEKVEAAKAMDAQQQMMARAAAGPVNGSPGGAVPLGGPSTEEVEEQAKADAMQAVAQTLLGRSLDRQVQ